MSSIKRPLCRFHRCRVTKPEVRSSKKSNGNNLYVKIDLSKTLVEHFVYSVQPNMATVNKDVLSKGKTKIALMFSKFRVDICTMRSTKVRLRKMYVI